MLNKEFETWLADNFFYAIFPRLKMHVINQGHIQHSLFSFIEPLDCNIDEFNRVILRLENTAIILGNDKEQQ